MKSGIYIITCLTNNKHYVGRAKNWRDRLVTHKGLLVKNKHPNAHLQNAVNLYGIDNFSFSILEEFPESYLCAMEHYWCNLLNVHDRKYGYNIEPTSPFGRVSLSEETKLKISIFQKENPRKGVENPWYGKKHTEESKKKMSDSLMGRIISQESIEKRTNTRHKNAEERGFYHTEECKQNISKGNKDKPKSVQHVEALIKASTCKVAIEMYDMEWNFIKYFDSLSDARRELGCAVNLIYVALNNPNRSAKSFRFKYKNQI